MAEEKTENGDTKDYFFNRRDTINLNQEIAIFRQEDMPFLIEIIKEIHPSVELSNYEVLRLLVVKEFNMKIPESEFERYFSPSVEGIAKEYEYSININS